MATKKEIRKAIEDGYKGYPIQPMFDKDDNLIGHQYIPKIIGNYHVNGSIVKKDMYDYEKEDK